MPTSRDFDRVTIEDDGTTIRVEATTLDEALKPTSDDSATSIQITLVRLPEGIPVVTGQPTLPVGAAWSASFPNAAPDFEGAEEVLCVGIAICPDETPYVWHERRPLMKKSKTP